MLKLDGSINNFNMCSSLIQESSSKRKRFLCKTKFIQKHNMMNLFKNRPRWWKFLNFFWLSFYRYKFKSILSSYLLTTVRQFDYIGTWHYIQPIMPCQFAGWHVRSYASTLSIDICCYSDVYSLFSYFKYLFFKK